MQVFKMCTCHHTRSALAQRAMLQAADSFDMLNLIKNIDKKLQPMHLRLGNLDFAWSTRLASKTSRLHLDVRQVGHGAQCLKK